MHGQHDVGQDAAGRPHGDTNYAIHLSAGALKGRTFLLGNGGGFVLYLPVEQNTRDRTLVPIKWFGASEFGRKYLEVSLYWACEQGTDLRLDRLRETGFTQYLDHAERTFAVDGHAIRQTFLVPTGVHAFLLTLEADPAAGFVLEPEFDMRYYQTFNSDFTGYRAQTTEIEGRQALSVSNRITGPSTVEFLEFHSLVMATDGTASVEMLPERERLRTKTYLQDENRRKLIRESYALTHEQAPDEAPIWDTYETQVYVPARISASGKVTLAFAFGGRMEDARAALQAVSGHPAALAREKEEDVAGLLQRGALTTGAADIDTAYNQILSRFDEALVARDITVHAGDRIIPHFSAIFAGNKYFLDAWKRDENISLIAPMLTNDFPTVAAILRETWQYQDQRTGRLPQIIRLGEPLVYFSSDGTLWALRRLWQYTRMTGDESLLNEKYGMVEHFFAASLNFVKRGLLPSGGIVDKTYRWETWEDTPYTPRDGYPVEIELLWLTAVRDFESIIRRHNPELALRLQQVRQEGMETFRLFCLDGYLADSLTYDFEPRTILTPNGYIAFDLDFPLSPEIKRSMVLLAREQLAGQVGVKSLARRDWAGVLSPEFLGASGSIVDGHLKSVGLYNYHRGVEWLWLNQFMVEGELECGNAEAAYQLYLHGQVESALHRTGVGGLSELYDVNGPLGADFQAWSMAGFIASLHAFAGIEVDAIERVIRVRPHPPAGWPSYSCRRQVGSLPFELHFHRERSGTQSIRVVPVDAVPDGYTLTIGARVPHGASASMQVNGSGAASKRVSTCAPELDEVWTDVPLTGETRAIIEVQAS
jgi:glycogen debranching enzyme